MRFLNALAIMFVATLIVAPPMLIVEAVFLLGWLGYNIYQGLEERKKLKDKFK